MKRKPRLLDWARQAVLDAYLNNEKIEAIAAEFGVSKQYPSVLAKRRGFPTRADGAPKKVNMSAKAC